MGTEVGTEKKQPGEEVAKVGFEAMMSGDAAVIAGWKASGGFGQPVAQQTLAAQHRKMAEPGSASNH